MSYTRKSFEELNVMDDFLMTAVAADRDVGEEFCRTVLSVLLQRKIGKVHVTAQRVIPASTPKLRGIRMDVEIGEFGENEEHTDVDFPANIYDIEPHLKQDTKLERHNRFYQAKIDNRYVKRGEKDFKGMPNLYILTITNFDPFGYDYMMYRIRNQCEEVPDLEYEDGLEFIYFYTDGTKGGNAEIQAMLQYFKNSIEENAVNETTRKVHDYVSQVRILPEVKSEYMTLEEYIWYERQDERKETRRETIKETMIENILELLEEYGSVPEELEKRLQEESDTKQFKQWHKLAAKVDSISEFMQKMEEKQ